MKNKSKPTLEQLPEVVSQLSDQLIRIEGMLAKLAPPSAEISPLMNLKQASKFLNLAESTIYAKVCRMEIPVIKKAKKLYFQEGELLTWLMEGKRTVKRGVGETAMDCFENSVPRKARRLGLKR